MSTVTSVSIINPGQGYVNGTTRVVLDKTHALSAIMSNLYVDITVDAAGTVITATPVAGKTGLGFLVNDLVFVYPTSITTTLCILQIDSIQP